VWMPQTPVKQETGKLAQQIYEVIGDDDITRNYNRKCFSSAVLCFYTSALMQQTYARLFKGLSESQIDQVLSSFSLKQCKVNNELAGIVKKYSA